MGNTRSFLLALCCAVSGNVHTNSGVPLAGALVVVHGVHVARTTSDARGDFALKLKPGSYVVEASAKGYVPVAFAVDVTHDVALKIALASLDSGKLRLIGTVEVNGRLTPIRGVVPSIDILRDDYARLGESRVIAALEAIPSVTFSHPDGGAASAISVVSLRGPDPSETLIALDGQLLNDANTGDVDLSRFPIAAFSAVSVTEGLGAGDSEGSNTIGGAVNLISLQPTPEKHSALSLSLGTFGRSDAWFNTTGTSKRFGYAFALDNQHEEGYVSTSVPVNVIGQPACQPCTLPLGSSIASGAELANFSWTFSQRASIGARVFALGDNRDQSSSINGIDENASSPTFGQFIGPGNQTFAQNIRAYLIHGRFPLGAGDLVAVASADNDAVTLSGAASSPYDLTHQDKRTNLSLVWQRDFANSQFALGGYTRYEGFNFVNPSAGVPELGQSIGAYFLRGSRQVTHKLNLSAGAYESRYSTFGSNLDGRFGAVYDASPTTALRFSLGTGFRAPLLIERYLFPVDQLPPPNANCVITGQGNPNESPEHATEYELGISHQFQNRATFDASFYRTNLRDPIETFYPLGTQGPIGGTCAQTAFSYPVNAGNVVYQGAQLRYVESFARQHLFLTALYGLNVAYPNNLSSSVSNPTSGGNLVNGAQFLGIPQQQGSLELDYARAAWHAAINAVFRGNNNELNQPPFTLVGAALGHAIGKHDDLTISATNLFNAAAGRFTLFGGGVPYRGVVGQASNTLAPIYGNLPTNGYFVEPFGARVILTLRE